LKPPRHHAGGRPPAKASSKPARPAARVATKKAVAKKKATAKKKPSAAKKLATRGKKAKRKKLH
jgi:hypothetical protein